MKKTSKIKYKGSPYCNESAAVLKKDSGSNPAIVEGNIRTEDAKITGITPA